MYRLALKMLFADRGKYVMLLSGLVFATLLMTQQAGVFVGILEWTKGNLKNMRAPIWVVDPKVEQVNEVKALRDTDVTRVRSVPGVAWAVPMYWGILQARLIDGTFKPVQLVGLDNATMVGRPSQIVAGRIEDLRLPNAVIIDELAIERLSRGRPRPIGLGDIFEMNDKEARIVGICRTEKSFFGYPYIFSTYDQALQFAPKVRKMLSYILVAPKEGRSIAEVVANIRSETGLMAYSEEHFGISTVRWFFRNTGIPTSFGMTIVLGFIVGVAVAGQTFYAFILENLRHFGALKAMGASDGLLTRLVLLQAFAVGAIGYGIGLGVTVLIGSMFLKKGMPPFSLPWFIPVATLGAILFICAIAAAFGIRKIRQLEPAIVFRG
ncbi:MAG: FtsX-like permease family protein [Verrucomicrobiales bacterium]|nr:FtsX-like permease family protein [Verrucomicrobiales bacterium]